MFAPTKTYRRWHRKVNKNQRRYAIVSALAASSSTALVMARGHRVEQLPEIPLVVSNETIVDGAKTASAVKILKTLHAYADVEKVIDSRKLRRGKGKMRNRRHVQRRGPLIIYDQKSPLCYAFRNLPGVELCSVTRLSLLQLAPGGHLGRFVIWTKAAFERLESLYGSYRKPSSLKIGYRIPRPVITTSDLGRIINSQEIQSHLRQKKVQKKYIVHKKNPLKNLGFMIKLNPYAKAQRRKSALLKIKSKEKKAAKVLRKRALKKAAGKEGKVKKQQPEPAKKKKEGAKKIKMNPHKKTLIKSLRTNN